MNKPAQKIQPIFFIGCGPGDPELITVKGKRLLKEADMIVYAGSLVKEKVLQYAKKEADIYNSASMALEEIMKIVVDAASARKKVVRLHSGDPTLYSALREQADILDKEKIPYEVIPGVSSAFASAAALKRELTMPEITQTVIFTRLEGRTPVAVVYRATWEDERIIKGRLKDIANKVKKEGIKRQAMIIVGKTLGQGTVPAGSKQGAKYKEGQKSKLYDRNFEHGYRKKKV